ncbi:hypothetical protein, partial [Actinokineospora iranica]
SQAVFGYLRYYSWLRVCRWLRKHHKGLSWRKLHPRAFTGSTKWEIRAGEVTLFDPTSIPSKRYRYRGAKIPTPWSSNAA